MSDTIGDYYDRVEKRRQEAYKKWNEAREKYAETGQYEDYLAAHKAFEEAMDAGNTGD
jgi:hypothetical protein